VRAVGQRLRWLREACEQLDPGHRSLTQWATALGYDHSSLSRWENGKYLPRADIIWRIVQATQTDWNYIYGGVLSPEVPETLRETLLAAHPGDLVAAADFYRERARAHAALRSLSVAIEAQGTDRRRKRKRPLSCLPN
jgi:transcriptional regulator with XRE-family HTH domain